MKYTNTIYLKDGRSIRQGSDVNLSEQIKDTIDWDIGTIYLNSKNKTAIPKKNVSFIDTKVNEEKDI